VPLSSRISPLVRLSLETKMVVLIAVVKKQPVKNSVLAISMEDRIIFFITH
jgi:hypothetical protein